MKHVENSEENVHVDVGVQKGLEYRLCLVFFRGDLSTKKTRINIILTASDKY